VDRRWKPAPNTNRPTLASPNDFNDEPVPLMVLRRGGNTLPTHPGVISDLSVAPLRVRQSKILKNSKTFLNNEACADN
jgi:hypothetical protein